jgi:hypothetical protein
MMRSMLPRVKKIAFHPLVFATFPILSLFGHKMGNGYLREALLTTVGAIVLCLLLWLLVRVLLKDGERAALVASAFFFLLLSFGHALAAANGVLERTGLIDRWWILVRGPAADIAWTVLWVLLFAAVTFHMARRLKNVCTATDLLNIVAVALVVMLGFSFFSEGGFANYLKPYLGQFIETATGGESSTEQQQLPEHRTFIPLVQNAPASEPVLPKFGYAWLDESAVQASAPDRLPDIYYIVLDMYARSDVLHELFQYDNSEFLSYLDNKGFYVARESTSNYPYATHSLASTLNYMYINQVAEEVGPIQGHSLSASMIANSRLFGYLESQGYKTVAFATGYWFTELRDSDVFLEPSQLRWNPSEFQAGLLELTPLSRIAGLRGTRDEVDRQRVLYTFEDISDAAELEAPTLTFAHINAPHDPYVFAADGQPIASRPGYTYEEWIEAYGQQAAFVTWKAQQTIEDILRRSPEPPIIILQSDHAACYGPYGEHLADRMSILNAYDFPNQDYEVLYQTITPVNTFRIVLNHYLGTDYALLADRDYFADTETPYDFVDVTDQVSPGR